MATLLVDKRDQLFVLNEMLEVDKLCDFPQFSEHSGFDMVLTEAHRFAKAEFYPTLQEGDREGCVYDPQTRTVAFPECFKKPYEKFREGGWLAMCDSPAVGGDGFPMTIGTAVSELFYAAGFYIYGAAELSHAGAKVIEKFGTDDQKARLAECAKRVEAIVKRKSDLVNQEMHRIQEERAEMDRRDATKRVLTRLYKRAQDMKKQGMLESAREACGQMLEVDPGNSKATRLLNTLRS